MGREGFEVTHGAERRAESAPRLAVHNPLPGDSDAGDLLNVLIPAIRRAGGEIVEGSVTERGLAFTYRGRGAVLRFNEAYEDPTPSDQYPVLAAYDDGCGDGLRSFGPFGSQAVDPTD